MQKVEPMEKEKGFMASRPKVIKDGNKNKKKKVMYFPGRRQGGGLRINIK